MTQFNPRSRLRFDFAPDVKDAIALVLDKFGDNPPIDRIRNAVAIDGSTCLHADEALMLAGMLLPWYDFLSQRIIEHPGFAPTEEATDGE